MAEAFELFDQAAIAFGFLDVTAVEEVLAELSRGLLGADDSGYEPGLADMPLLPAMQVWPRERDEARKSPNAGSATRRTLPVKPQSGHEVLAAASGAKQQH